MYQLHVQILLKKYCFLKTNIEPYETIYQYWKETSEARVYGYAECNSIQAVIDLYPALKQPLGYTLVCFFRYLPLY